MTFSNWIDTFISEKGIDPMQVLEVKGQSGLNMMPVSIVIDAMKATASGEQAQIKTAMVRLDFANAPIKPFIEHMAQAIAI